MLGISGYEQDIILKRTSQWLRGKESACSAEDVGSIPGLGRSPGERNGLQYSFLGNPTDRGSADYSPEGRKSQTQHSD